ncbi:rod shape-determining protein RodA [uncultured Alistipes sp.]|jgi:Bacterial cell division membrane protein|uniref:rod shape-determining protein RodA n=1 Tax=uncultured Alistipes sp. TaxID=538949 RepID=UPI0025DC1F54|nr:rod shape-determining protein RodA [uncultured Alistipes sp.]
MTGNRHNSIFYGVDRWTVLLYVLIVLVGWVSITAASYDEGTGDVFAFSHFYMKQLVWIGVAWVTALVVVLLDERYFHMFAYPAYFVGLAMLLAALLFGREVNGAKAWFEFGSFRVQPVEFAKIATALALARVMSAYSFSINRPGDLFKVGLVICVPLFIIILQNDTGSGIVLCSFLFVLYREGLNKWLCIPVLMIAALFIVSFLLSPMTLLVSIILVCTLSEAMMTGLWRSRVVYLASLALASILLCMAMALIAPGAMDLYACLLTVTLVSLVGVAIYAYRSNLSNTFITIGLFLCTMIFLPSTDYIFNSILKQHQRDRILSFLGIISDPLGTDYNVNQSKIAIGSGGMWGKGFLEGTQIKYGFVPERHTDFIFCTVGEEWGFAGAIVVLTLLCLLIMRLIRMGERQQEAFGRIYCYCVAAILLFHVLVNVGMTIGLMPVMGIPLPFMSYGGSSLIAFTIMLFIAVRLDASTRQFSVNKY